MLYLRRALAHRDGGDLIERHHHIAATDRNGKMLDIGCIHPIIRVQSHRDIARFAGRVHPVSDFDTGKRDTQGLRRIADRNTQRVGESAVEFNLQFVFGVLLGKADIDRAGNLGEFLHEVTGDGKQAARIRTGKLDLHGLSRAVVQIVEHRVLGADDTQ